MRTAEVKRRFLDHFAARGHAVVPSAPLPADAGWLPPDLLRGGGDDVAQGPAPDSGADVLNVLADLIGSRAD